MRDDGVILLQYEIWSINQFIYVLVLFQMILFCFHQY